MTPSPRVLTAAALLLPLVLGGGFLPARAETVDEAIKTFEDYLKTKPAADGLKNHIAELAQKKDPKVAKTLLPLLQNPDVEVKIAVCQNIGKQGATDVVASLTAIFKAGDDIKKKDRKPEDVKLMCAALEGIGDANAKGSYDFLIKTGRHFMDSNGDLTASCYRAASNYVTVDTVDDFIKDLGTADYVTTKDGPEKSASRNAVKPVINGLLEKMTGQQIKDVKIWREWWDKNKKTWKPPVAGTGDAKKDINASEVFSDAAYGFTIKKPNTRWSFKKPDGAHPYLELEALEEGQRAAWVEVGVVGTKTLKSKTPEAFAEEQRPGFEGKFRDFKSQEWAKKGTCGGKKCIEQILFGQHKDYDAVQMHNVYVENSEVMYYLVTYYKSGKTASLKDDIEAIIKSLTFTR